MSGETVSFDKAGDAATGKREQSSISFPYLDLDAAIEVARAVYNRSGLGSCDLDELAAEMSQTMSGAFRLKTGTAKIFDLVDKEGKSSIKLSDLGRQIVTPGSDRAARAEAFLRVPLYAAIYEKYKGHLLPPMKALEREMQALGVASKQADKARQAFERSARQAGYYESGEDRLVRPRADLSTRKADEDGASGANKTEDAGSQNNGGKPGGGGSGGAGGGDGISSLKLDPVIIEFLKKIPVKETGWSASARHRWFKTFAMLVSEVYDAEDSPVEISISLSAAPVVKKPDPLE